MPMWKWNRDKRRRDPDPYYMGKKLHKGSHGHDLDLALRGGDERHRRHKDSWRPWRDRHRNQGSGGPGPFGGILPGPGFWSGEDMARDNHRKLEQRWGFRGRRVEEGFMRGHGPFPPGYPGYPPRPPLPTFHHLPRRRMDESGEFEKIRNHMRRSPRPRGFPSQRYPHLYDGPYNGPYRPPHGPRYGAESYPQTFHGRPGFIGEGFEGFISTSSVDSFPYHGDGDSDNFYPYRPAWDNGSRTLSDIEEPYFDPYDRGRPYERGRYEGGGFGSRAGSRDSLNRRFNGGRY
jgi:hypothetical protein